MDNGSPYPSTGTSSTDMQDAAGDHPGVNAAHADQPSSDDLQSECEACGQRITKLSAEYFSMTAALEVAMNTGVVPCDTILATGVEDAPEGEVDTRGDLLLAEVDRMKSLVERIMQEHRQQLARVGKDLLGACIASEETQLQQQLHLADMKLPRQKDSKNTAHVVSNAGFSGSEGQMSLGHGAHSAANLEADPNQVPTPASGSQACSLENVESAELMEQLSPEERKTLEVAERLLKLVVGKNVILELQSGNVAAQNRIQELVVEHARLKARAPEVAADRTRLQATYQRNQTELRGRFGQPVCWQAADGQEGDEDVCEGGLDPPAVHEPPSNMQVIKKQRTEAELVQHVLKLLQLLGKDILLDAANSQLESVLDAALPCFETAISDLRSKRLADQKRAGRLAAACAKYKALETDRDHLHETITMQNNVICDASGHPEDKEIMLNGHLINPEAQLLLVQPVRPQAMHGMSSPFAEGPAGNLLGHMTEVSSAVVLLLGCADPSCLLTSLAAPPHRLRKLHVVLNDSNHMRLARTALLLLLAAELDPNSRADMQMLWEVWYCAAWSTGTLSRVQPFINRLLTLKGVHFMVAATFAHFARLLPIWRSWLAKEQPSSAKALNARQELVDAFKSHGEFAHCRSLGWLASEQVVKVESVAELEKAMLGAGYSCSADMKGVDLVHQVLQQDLDTLFKTGYLASNYANKKKSTPATVNATLLRPGSDQWCFEVHCSPASCWGPFSTAELLSAVKTGGSTGIIARLCIARLSQLVRNFQRNSWLKGQFKATAVDLHVKLVCMDSLQLCLGASLSEIDPRQGSHELSAHLPGSQVASSSPPPLPMLFDVIDSSTMADEVGLLPLLVAAGSRLKKVAHARLFTGTKEWWHNRSTYGLPFEHHVVNKLLCMPPSLTPTLLGLRLLTDLEADRPETADEQDHTYRRDGYRELVWMPVSLEQRTSTPPRLQAQLLGGPEGSIEACLQAIATQLCCVTQVSSSCTRGSTAGTPQLLAWLLASLAERTDMSALLEDSSSSSSQDRSRLASNGLGPTAVQQSQAAGLNARHKYVHMQRILWGLRTKTVQWLPHQFRVSFITGIDILRSSLQQHAPKAWLPAGVPHCQGVRQVLVPLAKHDEMGWYQMRDVRPVLVDSTEVKEQCKISSAKVDTWALKGTEAPPSGVHLIDTWVSHALDAACWSPKQAKATVYLPVDYALCPEQLCFAGIKIQARAQQSLAHNTSPAPSTLAQLLLPSACPSAALHPQPSRHVAMLRVINQRGPSLKLQVSAVTETKDMYMIVLKLVDSQGAKVTQEEISSRYPPSSPGFGSMWVQYEGCSMPHLLGHDNPQATGICDCQGRQLSTAHYMVIKLSKAEVPAGPVVLQLCWPVAVGRAEPGSVTAGSYSSPCSPRLIPGSDDCSSILTLPKAEAWEMWPRDGLRGVLPATLNLASLLPTTAESLGAINYSLLAQYSPKVWKTGQLPRKLDPPINNRTILDDLIRLHIKLQPAPGVYRSRFTAHGTFQSSDGSKQVTTLHLLLHPPVLMTKAGRPVLPVTVLDVSMCEYACARGDMEEGWFHNLLRRHGFEPGQHTPWNTDLMDCVALRRLLLRHAMACETTAAQQASLPDGQRIPYYYNSYLSYMQGVYAHGFKYQAGEVAQNTGTKGSPSMLGASVHQKYRAMEILQELDRGQSQQDKEGLCRELQLLSAQDGASMLPAELQARARLHLSMVGLWGFEPSTQGSSFSQVVVPKAHSADNIPSVCQPEKVQVPVQVDESACMQCCKQGCKLMKCGKCGAVEYCSRKCQVEHWKHHRQVCKPSST